MLGEENNQLEIKKPSSAKNIVGALMVILAVAAFVFFVSPQRTSLVALQTNISEQDLLRSELETKISTVEAAQSELDLQSEVSRSETLKAIPTEMLQDEVIRDLMEILDKHDVALNSIGFGRAGSEFENIDALRVSASFEGNYADLENFLKSVEANPRIFQVETISVQVDDLASGFKRVNFTLAINVFFQNAE